MNIIFGSGGNDSVALVQWAIEKYGIAKVKRMGEMAFKGGGTDSSARISTPTEFRDLLLRMAKSVHNRELTGGNRPVE